MRIRIEDVARAAGVSMKTVSRVLNQEPNVRDDTRHRVESAVAALNYRPHPSARSLAGNRSFLVALLYDNPSPNYLMEVISGVLDACEAYQYGMMLRPLVYDSRDLLRTVESTIAQSRPDGVVLTPPITDNTHLLRRLEELGVPYASVSPKLRKGCIGVTLEEQHAVREMMSHLVSLGHQRIAHIRGHPDHGASEWRLAGYRDGLKQAGIAWDPALVVRGEFSFDSGVSAARQLFDLARPPTAVFAANDDMAAGVIRVAAERGLRVPHDVSVCGFDDTPMSRQIFPPLTTVRQPSRDMGRIAATQLLRSLRDPASASMVCMQHTLQLRQSTGPAPAAGEGGRGGGGGRPRKR